MTGTKTDDTKESLKMEEIAFRSALLRIPGIGLKRFERLMTYFGSGMLAYMSNFDQLNECLGSIQLIEEINKWKKHEDPLTYLNELNQRGILIISRDLDASYSQRLRRLEDAPPILYVRGNVEILNQRAIAVVGTRKPTSYGVEVTQRLVAELVAGGLTVVSGLARGIDRVAHRSALESGGATIAVMGAGVETIYPPEHTSLAEEMVRSGKGVLVSEFADGVIARRGNFVIRNRIVAGLGEGVLVTEGALKSGTLITTDYAKKQGKKVFAVPGMITSQMSAAPYELLRSGAVMVTGSEDIFRELAISKTIPMVEKPSLGNGLQKKVWELLSEEGCDVDRLAKRSGESVDALMAELTMMELEGVVKRIGDEYWV